MELSIFDVGGNCRRAHHLVPNVRPPASPRLGTIRRVHWAFPRQGQSGPRGRDRAVLLL